MKTSHFVMKVFTLLAVSLSAGHQAFADSSLGIGLNFNYSTGNNNNYGYGSPYGYGVPSNSFQQIGAVCGGQVGMPAPIIMPQPSPCGCSACSACGGGCGQQPMPFQPPIAFQQPMFQPPPIFTPPPMPMIPPALPPMRPPQPFLPPHLAQPNMGWGPNFCSYQQPVIPGPSFGPSCVPCQLGMRQAYAGPVPGGPLVGDGGYDYARVNAGYRYERNDAADIVLNAGIAMQGVETKGVYPVAYPRYEMTGIQSAPLFTPGDRSTVLDPRDHVSP